MKVTQDLIVFDLEATASINANGYQENKHIIQLGAVYLKRIDSSAYEITSRFESLVRPLGEKISPFITDLTGITNDMVEDAADFSQVGLEFSGWARKNGNIKRTKLCAWGSHFDIPLLRSNYELMRMDYPFVGGGYDIKSWAVLWMMLNGHSEKMGLREVCDTLGIQYEGTLHHALSDAVNTAHIALRVLQDFNLRLNLS